MPTSQKTGPDQAEETGPPRAPLPLRVLLVDDEETIRVTLMDDLDEAGYRVTAFGDGAEALESLRTEPYDVVVSDLRMPGADGMEVLDAARSRAIEVILMTAHGTIENAVDAMRKGAFHYVLKPFMNDEILMLLAHVARLRKLEEQNRSLTEDLGRLEGFENVIGNSPAMAEVLTVVKTVAVTDSSILIEGESGTGKEVIARAIHFNSPRRDGPFVALSCAALPESLLEAELFGHERGAFTDARKERRGRFEQANGGTFFLDDVDDLSMPVQVKLLRALQERVIERVGGESAIPIDIRVVTATKKNLMELMAEEKFREDLFYRLNVVPLKLPPLRDRSEDVPLLARHFVRLHGRGREYEIPPAVMDALCLYPWPGNVRELENSVERAIAMAGDSRSLKKEHLLLPSPRFKNAAEISGPVVALKEVVSSAEAAHIRRVLKTTGNHKAQAASLLGISRKNLWEKMKEYGIKGDS